MSRSTKKGPYLDEKLTKKILKSRTENSKKLIKTWSRAATITPDMVGITLGVHNGRDFANVFITESMVGQRLGEFSPTRKFTGHSKKGKIAKATGSAGRTES
jgi:small subunit ribosomal protein S19